MMWSNHRTSPGVNMHKRLSAYGVSTIRPLVWQYPSKQHWYWICFSVTSVGVTDNIPAVWQGGRNEIGNIIHNKHRFIDNDVCTGLYASPGCLTAFLQLHDTAGLSRSRPLDVDTLLYPPRMDIQGAHPYTTRPVRCCRRYSWRPISPKHIFFTVSCDLFYSCLNAENPAPVNVPFEIFPYNIGINIAS